MLKKMLEQLSGFGMTQVQISTRTGIPQPTISRLISGKQKDLAYTQGKRIEQLLDEVLRSEKG